MAEAGPSAIRVHEDPDLFREALNFTAAETAFPPHLVEKDYFCTVLLAHLALMAAPLVFRGGTCLAKVHGDFYRLSEDLDFVIPLPVTASRSRRSKQADAIKRLIAELAKTLPCYQVAAPLAGANDSSQYNGTVSYSSMITQQSEGIAIEIGLREPLLMPATLGSLRTMLLDPISGQNMVLPIAVPCIARLEAFAEKFRAALTRREVAIRDFYDVDYAVRKLGIQLEDAELVALVKKKLAVPGNEPVHVGPDRLAQLRGQVDARLKPVLRGSDFDAFDLDRAFKVVAEMANRIAD